MEFTLKPKIKIIHSRRKNNDFPLVTKFTPHLNQLKKLKYINTFIYISKAKSVKNKFVLQWKNKHFSEEKVKSLLFL